MIEFENDDRIYQITFSFPDKKNKFRRYTFAKISMKIINPENSEDYIWSVVGGGYSKCNILFDYFDKEIGRYYAFKNLIDKWHNKEFRTKVWKLYLEKYGIKPKIKSVYKYFSPEDYLLIKSSDKDKRIINRIKALDNIED